MKKSLLFLTLLVIGFASCKKDDSYNAPYVPPYHIDGIRDITLQKSNFGNASDFLNLAVIYENSDQEKISLSVEGVPAGMISRFNDSTGYPTFNSSLYLRDSSVVVGNYTLKLVATGTMTGRREFPFNVNVLAAPVLNALIAGNGYNSYTSCGSGSFMQNISAVSGTTNNILFSNFDNSGNQVEANLVGDESNGNVIIPTQTVNGTTYSSTSTGYYYISSGVRHISVSFYRSNSSGSNYCTLDMTL